MEWIDTVPVYGFNSAAYDVNVVKRYLSHLLMKGCKKSGNISKKEKERLSTVEELLGRKLEQNIRIQQFNVGGIDLKTKTVYEFNGCFFHGCPKCYNSGEKNLWQGN